MITLFLICAGVGATVLVGQMLIGMMVGSATEGASDLSHHVDHGGNALFGVLTVRGISAAVAGFGIAGMASASAGMSMPWQIALALAGGALMLGLVVTVMKLLTSLEGAGNLDLTRATGMMATVYVPIPAEHSGEGKVHIDLQGRTHEIVAVTFGPALATGARVRVVQVVDRQTVEVVAAAHQGIESEPNP